MANIQGYILAGGKSQRFGSDKARVLLDGELLIERAVRCVRDLGISATVVADPADRFADLDLPTIVDLRPDHGPLGGLAAALKDCPHDSWAFVTCCDLKVLRPHWFEQLRARISIEYQAVAFRDQAWQPLVALYTPALLSTVTKLLDSGDLSLQRLLDQVATQPVELPRDWLTPPSINTPTDLDVLRSQEPSHEHRP